MAKIFIAISILVTALTAALGFLTKSKVDNLKKNLTQAQQDGQMAHADATKAKGDLKKKNEELDAASKTMDEQKSQLTTLEGSVAAAKKEADDAKAAVAAGEEKIKDLETKVAANQGAGNTSTPGLDPPEVVAMREKLAKTEQELKEAQQVQEALRNREHESADKLQAALASAAEKDLPYKQAGASGRIVAVNPGWNFVVVDIGDHRGARINSPLLVTRGGSVVARLRITSVEPSTSIADVLPGSMARGDKVQPGDRVVFAGRQMSAPNEAPSDAGGPTAANRVNPPLPAH